MMRKDIRGCTPWSSGCHHLLEGVPYIFSLLSSLRLQALVAVVLFLQGLAHWMEFFLTAPMTQLISFSFFPRVHFDIRVARAPKWVNFLWRNKLAPVSHGHCARLLGRLDSLSVLFTTKTSMSATRASDFHPTGLRGAEGRRDFDGHSLTANYELRLIKVCDEVSMCLCFWLAAVIGTRQERLPPLLVDPACMLKLAWSTCRVKHLRWRRSKDVAVVMWLPPPWTIREPLSLPWCKCLVFFSRSSSPELSHSVMTSLYRQRAAHAG